MILLIRADQSFAVQTGATEEARNVIECNPHILDGIVQIVEWDGALPDERIARSRWRWDGSQIVILPDEEDIARQEAEAIAATPPPVPSQPAVLIAEDEDDEPFEMPRVFRNDLPPAPEPPEQEPDEYYDDRPDFGAELAAFKARADDFLAEAARRVRSIKPPEPAGILADHYEKQIRYEIAIRAINGDVAAMEMMAAVAQAMGMSIADASTAIIGERKRSEQEVMSAYAQKLGASNAASN